MSLRAFRKWCLEDPWRLGLALGGFLWALFLAQGLPFWDWDFAVFRIIQNRSVLQILGDLISPVYTGPGAWGFFDRVLQFLSYKISWLIAGYDTWPYVLFKSICYAGLGVMIYEWILRLAPGRGTGRRAGATAACIFFLLAPGPSAAQIWLADFAIVAELCLLILTFVLWREVERTPREWHTLWLSDPAHRRWALKWTALSFLVYLGYKSKADLKLIPVMLAAYLLLVRRNQWRVFIVPIGLMLLLAVPWNSETFRTPPPFVPGTAATPGAYTWQPASLKAVGEYVWSRDPFNIAAHISVFSLAGSLGPFLLAAIIIFSLWRLLASGHPIRPISFETPQSRARLFTVIWFFVMLAGTAALPLLSDFFRVRYSILFLIPATILMGSLFCRMSEPRPRLPVWALSAFAILFVLQTGINANRALAHRAALGHVMLSTDRAYAAIESKYPGSDVTFAPDFQPYDYRPGSRLAVQPKDTLASVENVALRHSPNQTLVLSHTPLVWEQLDLIGEFNGCGKGLLFDKVMPCEPAAQQNGAFLYRYIGPDPVYRAAARAQARGDSASAKALYSAFLSRHPGNAAAQLQFAMLHN